MDKKPEKGLPFSAAVYPHWHTGPRKCPFHSSCSSWLSPGSIHPRQDLKASVSGKGENPGASKEYLGLMANVKRNKQLKIGFVVVFWFFFVFFFFFLERLLKCNKFIITFFSRKNIISSLGDV